MAGQAFKRPRFHASRMAAVKRRRLGRARRLGGAAQLQGRFAGQIHRGREYKFHDELFSATMTTGGTILLNGSLNEIAQGIQESQRVGRKIVIKSVQMKAKYRLSTSTGATGNNLYRVIIFQDKQCNGATAVVLDLLEQADLLSFYNLANSSRFRILLDETKVMNPSAGAGNGTANDFNEVFHFKEYSIPVNIPIEFDNSASTGAIATIRSNNIGLLVIMNEATEDVTIAATTRLRFSDA